MSNVRPPHVEGFLSNLQEVSQLIQIHEKVVGSHRGYKPKVEVLNKSGIVLLTACWESFIEDLASASFDHVLQNAKSHTSFPNNVLVLASNTIRSSLDERLVWQLAGDGWLSILKDHKERIFEKYLYRFSSPNPDNIDNLFEDLLGIKSMSSYWHWPRMSSENARANLTKLIKLRGSIAHRVVASAKVYKPMVWDYLIFLNRLAVATHNTVATHIRTLLGKSPWISYVYRPPK
ncbi:MAG TPA: HEPN domain-containing protein [Bacteroidota bacterium]|jgi:hypothetical protein|nr:HEPN domain-containing protein [Bacteroidota bacterium]